MHLGEILCNVSIVGDEQAGKSSIVNQYLHNTFYENYDSTIAWDIVM